MLVGRLGRAWLLECTIISFREFFSLARTGQTLALNGSQLCGIGMPREVKKEGGTSECCWPLFPPGVACWNGMWGDGDCASGLGEASLGVCFFRPWKDHPLVVSSWCLGVAPAPLFPSARLVKGLVVASKARACELSGPGSPKHSWVFRVDALSFRLSVLADWGVLRGLATP